jgi:hypothetical protein
MAQTINLIYLRVSKQDLDNGKTEQQVLEDQLPPILKKFNLKESECHIYKEKGSAYNIDKLKNRTEFLELLNICFNSKSTTIEDLFLGNYVIDSNIKLFVFDSNRLMRNIEFGMLFAILRSLFKVKLFSVNQDNLNITDDDLIGVRMSKYLMGTVDSYLAEGYSQNISDHTKKAIKDNKGITVSKNGNKWGKSLKRNDKPISVKETQEINKAIIDLIRFYEKKNIKFYFDYIIKYIKENQNINISKTYISNLKNECN